MPWLQWFCCDLQFSMYQHRQITAEPPQCCMSIAVLCVHRSAVCPSQCCMSIAVLYVHHSAAVCCCFTHLSLLLSLPLLLLCTADPFIYALRLGASSSCCLIDQRDVTHRCCCCLVDVYQLSSVSIFFVYVCQCFHH